MARPFKSGVDYFPLDVNPDDKIELIEAEHGLIGFGALIKLYQKIYANNYWIKWGNKSLIVFSSKINVDKNLVNECINSCLEWGVFDKNMYDNFDILTSRGIQKRFFYIVRRRKCVEIILDYLLVDCPKLEEMNLVNVDVNDVNATKSTQSKVKESTVKKRKEKEKKHTYSEAFEECWKIVPKRNGVKEGKKPSSILFEKLDYEEKRKCYRGLRNYAEVCNKTDKKPKDFERFIKHEIYNDYQEKVTIPSQIANQPKKEKSLSEIASEMKKKDFDIELTDYEEVPE